jgi:hypothetical protein
MSEEKDKISMEWWTARRLRYNIGLAIAGLIAYIIYFIAVISFVHKFEFNLFIIFFQCLVYLFMTILANIIYTLVYYIERDFNSGNSEKYRKNLFIIFCAISYILPFSIPLLFIIL